MAQDVVRAGGLLHPPGLQFSELIGASNGLFDTPLLIGVDHKEVISANLLANDATAAQIVALASETSEAKNINEEIGAKVSAARGATANT